MKYIAKRPFASFGPGDKLVEFGDPVEIKNKKTAQDMIDKGLVFPNYSTKEDKQAYSVDRKATIEWDSGPMFYVKQGDKVIDRLKKTEAEALRDEINAEIS